MGKGKLEDKVQWRNMIERLADKLIEASRYSPEIAYMVATAPAFAIRCLTAFGKEGDLTWSATHGLPSKKSDLYNVALHQTISTEEIADAHAKTMQPWVEAFVKSLTTIKDISGERGKTTVLLQKARQET